MDFLRIPPKRRGFLLKGDPTLKKWEKRMFVLHGCRLAFYKESEKFLKAKPRGIINLREIKTIDFKSDNFPKKKMKGGLVIKTLSREYQMFSESSEDIKEWRKAIEDAMSFHFDRAQIESKYGIKFDPDVNDIFSGFFLGLRFSGLAARDANGLNDPFIEIRPAANPTSTLLFRSEITFKTVDPHFDPFVLSAERICRAANHELDEGIAGSTLLLIKVYDFDDDGSHDLIGVLETTMDDLIERVPSSSSQDADGGYTLINKEWKKMRTTKKGEITYKSCGSLHVEEVVRVYSARAATEPPEMLIDPEQISSEVDTAAAKELRKQLKKKKKTGGIEGYVFSLSCSNLMKMDLLGKTDPVLTVSAVPKGSMKGTQPVNVCVYWSETHMNTYETDFEPFTLPADLFDESSVLNFVISDWDKDGLNYVGKVSASIGSLMVSKGHRFALLKDKEGPLSIQLRDPGYLILNYCVAEPNSEKCPKYIPSDVNAVEVVLECSKLDRKDLTGSSDPFLEIIGQEREEDFKVRKRYGYPSIRDEEPSAVFRSGVQKKNRNPTFTFQIDVKRVGGLDGLVNLQVSDADNSGGHDLIGRVENVTLRTLLTTKPMLPLKNPKKESRGKLYRNSGFVQTKSFEKKKSAPLPPTLCEVSVEIKNIKFQLGDVPDPFLEVRARPLVPPRQVTAVEMYNAGEDSYGASLTGGMPAFVRRLEGESVVYRSERYKDKRNIKFRPFNLDVFACGGMDSELRICLFDQEKSGAVEIIGTCKTTLRQMVEFHDDLLWTRMNTPQEIIDQDPEARREMRYTALFNARGRSLNDGEAPASFEGPGGLLVQFGCTSLPNLDAKASRVVGRLTGDKSDPFIVVQESYTKQLLYKSEVVTDNLNPDFQQAVISCMEGPPLQRYSRGLDELVVDVMIYDFDKDGTHDLIDSIEGISLRELTFPSASWILKTHDSKLVTAMTGRPELHIRRCEVINPDAIAPDPYAIKIKLGATGLDRKDIVQAVSMKRLFYRRKKEKKKGEGSDQGQQSQQAGIDSKSQMGMGKADPFLEIYNSNNQLVHKSEIVFNSLEAQWAEFTLRVDHTWLARCSLDEILTIIAMDYDRDGDADFIGMTTATLRELTMPSQVLPLLNEKKQKILRIAYRNSGLLRVLGVEPLVPSLTMPSPPQPYGYSFSFSATNLDNKEAGRKPRAFFIVYTFPRRKLPADPWKRYASAQYELAPIPTPVYRSENAEGSEPAWNSFVLSVDQLGGSLDSFVCVEVYHLRSNGGVNVIGGFSCRVLELTCPQPRWPLISKQKKDRDGKQAFRLYPYHNSGELHCLVCEPVPFIGGLGELRESVALETSADCFEFTIAGMSLDNKDVIGKSDPFFTVTGIPNPLSIAPYIGSHQLKREPAIIYRSEVKMNDLNPSWTPFRLDVDSCGDRDCPIIITVYDWEKNGAHEVIGSCIVSFRQMELAMHMEDVKFPLHPVKQRLHKRLMNKKYSGYIHIKSCAPSDPYLPPLAVNFKAKVKGLDRKDGFGLFKSDPFLSLYVEYPQSPTHSSLDAEALKMGGSKEIDFALAQQAMVDEMRNKEGLEGRETVAGELGGENSVAEWDRMDGSLRSYLTWYGMIHSGCYWRRFMPYGSRDYSHEAVALDDQIVQIYCSERYKHKSSPEFEEFILEVEPFVSLDNVVYIGLFDYDMDGTHDLIAMAKTTFRELVFCPKFDVPLINEERKRSKPLYRNSGMLTIEANPIWATPPPRALGFVFDVEGYRFDRKDTFSSDPYIEIVATPLSAGAAISRPAVVVYRSEVHKKNLSPHFSKFPLTVTQTTSLDTPIDFVVKDWDKDGTHDLIGEMRTTLRMMGTSKLPSWKIFNPEKKKSILRSANSGNLKLNPSTIVDPAASELQPPPAVFCFNCHAKGLDKKDIVSRSSDPYLSVYASPMFYESTSEDELDQEVSLLKGLVEVYRSEVIMGSLQPQFAKFYLPTIACGSVDTPFRIALFDWDKDGKPDVIGVSEEISLRIGSFRESFLPLINSKKEGRPGYRNSGILTIKTEPDTDNMGFVLPTMVNLTISASSLQRMDVFSKGDPCLIIKRSHAVLPSSIFQQQQVGPGQHFLQNPVIGSEIDFSETHIYRSEVHRKTDTCTFRPFDLSLEDCGGPYNELDIQVMDWDNDGSLNLTSSFRTNYFLLASQSGMNLMQNKVPLPTTHLKRNAGYLHFVSIVPGVAKPLGTLSNAYRFKMRAKNIDRKDILSKTDPYLVIKGSPYETQEPVVLYKSETHMKDMNPSFEPFNIELGAAGGFFSKLILEVYDFDAKSNDDLVGSCEVNLKELISAKNDTEGSVANAFPLVNKAKKSRKPGYRNSGVVYIENVEDVTESRHAAEFRFSFLCKNLDRKDVLSKNDPFVEVLGHPFIDHRSHLNRKQKAAFRAGMSIYDPIKGWTQKAAPSHAIPMKSYLNSNVLSETHVVIGDSVLPRPSAQLDTELCPILRTKVLTNTSDPLWPDLVLSPTTCGGMDRELLIAVYDFDANGNHALIGDTRTTLRNLVSKEGTENRSNEMPLINPRKAGSAVHALYRNSGYLCVSDLVPNTDKIMDDEIIKSFRVVLSAKELDRMDVGSRSDPYFEIVRALSDQEKEARKLEKKSATDQEKNIIKLEKIVYKSEIFQDSANCVWSAADISLSKAGGFDNPLKFSVYDSGEGKILIGSFETSARQLTFVGFKNVLMRPGGSNSALKFNCGVIEVISSEIVYEKKT